MRSVVLPKEYWLTHLRTVRFTLDRNLGYDFWGKLGKGPKGVIDTLTYCSCFFVTHGCEVIFFLNQCIQFIYLMNKSINKSIRKKTVPSPGPWWVSWGNPITLRLIIKNEISCPVRCELTAEVNKGILPLTLVDFRRGSFFLSVNKFMAK